MALTPASILADYTSGIGTQGATLKVNTSDKRIGIGTTNPQGTLQVGTGITMGSGIITATSADFSGNVSVGGVLTYEDVTNVDSVGVITARSGVHILNGDIGVGTDNTSLGKAVFFGSGEGNDQGPILSLVRHSNTPATNDRLGALNFYGKDSDDNTVYYKSVYTRIVDPTSGSATGQLCIGTNHTTAGRQVIIDADGSVGIGTDNITEKLHVVGDARVTGILTVGTAGVTVGAHEYPTIRPTLDLNFAATKTLDRRITFTRDGVGTYVDDMCIIKYASNNVPRFDHDPTTGESLGLLIEESRTNLHTYSHDLSQWTSVGVPLVVNDTTAPDGTVTADKLTGTSGTSNGGHNFIGDAAESTLTANTTYNCSIFLKHENIFPGGLAITRIGIHRGSWYAYLDISWTDSEEISSIGNFSASNIVYESYPNKWYRISFTFTTPSSVGTNTRFYVHPDRSGNQASVWVWGAQLEAGNFATSYIPTDGSTVTRAADYAKITGTNFTDFYNATESAISVRFNMYGYTNVGYNRVYEISDGTISNKTHLANDSTNSTFYETFIINGSNNLSNESEAITFGNFYNYTASFKKNDYQRYLNVDGTLEGHADSSIEINNFSPTQIIFGGHLNSPTRGILNGHISYFKYYPKRLPNAQLQGLIAT
jgi:hypothetical protein